MSEEIRRELERILKSKKIGPSRKDAALKEITGRCCVCGNMPTQEVIYQLQDAKRIEKYCDSCIKKVYERDQVL